MKSYMFILIFLFSINVFPQNNGLIYSKYDNSFRFNIKRDFNLPVLIKPHFFIPLGDLDTFPDYLDIGAHSYETIFENYTELPPSIYSDEYIYENSIVLPTDILLPLQLQFNNQNRFKFLYSILDAVQTGAVGILAVNYIQKYGISK